MKPVFPLKELDFRFIKTEGGYDYYSTGEHFNIVPANSLPPESGYRSAAYILAIKGIAKPKNEKEAREYFKEKK